MRIPTIRPGWFYALAIVLHVETMLLASQRDPLCLPLSALSALIFMTARRPVTAAVWVPIALLAALPAAAQTNKEVRLQVIENKVVACDFCVELDDSAPPDTTVYLGAAGPLGDASCNATTKVCTPTHMVAEAAYANVPTSGMCDRAAVTNGRVRVTLDPTDAMNKNGYQLQICASDTEGGYHCCDGKVFVENTRLFSTIP